MLSDRRCGLLPLAVVLAACGGFGRGAPSPDAGCVADGVGFDADVHPLLRDRCGDCHGMPGVADGTRLVLGETAADDYDEVRALVDTAQPSESPLLQKATGNEHGGGTALSAASTDYASILAWIEAGAPRAAGGCEPVDDAGARPFDAGAIDATVADDAAVDAGATPDAAPADAMPPDDDAGDEDAGPPPSYAATVHALLVEDCASCHDADGVASATGLVFEDDPVADYAAVLTFVDTDEPQTSALLTKAAGQSHGGGERFAEDSSEYAQILAWIEAGAAP